MSQAIAEFCVKVYTFLLPVSWIAVAIVVLVLLPLALFKGARSFSGTAIFFSSYIFGITTWFLGATVTFATWGWPALIIGFLLGGVGVVPIGILAAFFSLGSWSLGLSMIVMVIVVFAARVGGMALATSAERV